MKWICVAILLLTGVWVGAAPFEIADYEEPFPEGYVNHRTRVRDDKVEFSFATMEQWTRSVDSAAKRFTLQAPTNQLVLTIRLLTNAFSPKIEKFQEALTNVYDEITELHVYEATCGSGPGLGADFRQKVSGRFMINTQVAWFQAPEGTFEVSLTSPSAPIEQLQNLWGGFIGSVRVGPRPKK